MFELLNTAIDEFHRLYDCAPFVHLACRGAADEHWQLFHPSRLDMPCLVATPDNGVEAHPDRPF